MRLRTVLALAVIVVASAASLSYYRAPLPSPLTLELVLEPGAPAGPQPLITSGRTGAGDFLFIRPQGPDAIVVGYETWGEPGRFSPPVPIPADRRFQLTIEHPAFSRVRGLFARPTDLLRVTVNGAEAFRTPVNTFTRRPSQIHFGRNPIGGTACAVELNGRLLLPDGRELRGRPDALNGARARLHGWLFVTRWPAIAALLLGAATYVALGRSDLGGRVRRAVAALRIHRTWLAVAAAGTLAFAAIVTCGTFRLGYAETFGDFYDYQAESLLQGRLDVPWEAIGGEAFVHGGKNYGYFGPTPALLRLPFIIFDLEFGRLTRPLMIAMFAVTLFACYLVLRAARELAGLCEDAPPAWATLTVVGGAAMGSTLFYLGSRAYVYHEAILCGAMFALLAAWAALRHVLEPEKRGWIVSLLCGILSVHARAPTGFFALTFLGAMAMVVLVQRRRTQPRLARRQIVVGAACAFGVFSFNLLSYAKFRTFEGCPLRYNVQYDAARLARIDGRQFHLVNIPIAVDTYLVRPNFRFESGFPWFFLGQTVSDREWLQTKIDYHDKALGFPYAMPGLFGLATLGGFLAWRRVPSLRLALGATWAAAAPMTLAMFAAIALTHRYTADFCPFLITAAAFGTPGIDATGGSLRRGLRVLCLCATVASIGVTLAITVHHQGKDVWGVPDGVRENYAALQQRIDRLFGREGR